MNFAKKAHKSDDHVQEPVEVHPLKSAKCKWTHIESIENHDNSLKYVETYDHLVTPEGVCHVHWCTTGGAKSLEMSLKISQGSVSCDLLIESMGMHSVHEGIIINL